MSVMAIKVVKHNEYGIWYPLFHVAVVSWSSTQSCVMGVIAYLSILRVIKLLKTFFSATSCSLFNTLVSSVLGYCENVSYNRFTSSSICSTNFSAQFFTKVHLQWTRNISISKRTVYTHPDGTCVFIISVYNVLPSRSVFIWFNLSLYC